MPAFFPLRAWTDIDSRVFVDCHEPRAEQEQKQGTRMKLKLYYHANSFDQILRCETGPVINGIGWFSVSRWKGMAIPNWEAVGLFPSGVAEKRSVVPFVLVTWHI